MEIKVVLFLLLSFMFYRVFGQQPQSEMKPEMTMVWNPEVQMITPGNTPFAPPSDAIVLFDGSNLDAEWTNEEGNKPEWLVEDGYLTVVPGAGILKTKRVFEDFQLHIEWRTPSKVMGEGMVRGNSGIFLQKYYELQILDSYNNKIYRNGQAGSIFKQHAPLVNVCRKPGEWQTFDIIYTAPRFRHDGTYFTPPVATVIHNGVVIQNNVKFRGPTISVGIPENNIEMHGPESIVLQDHSSPVSFRNIWIREL